METANLIGAGNLIDILKVGFHGFALVMLFLGYNLMKDILKKKTKDPTETELKMTRLQLKNVIIFMIVSFFFFSGGVISEMIHKPKGGMIHVSINPQKMKDMEKLRPTLQLGTKIIPLELGQAELEIEHQNKITVCAEELVNAYNHQTMELKNLYNQRASNSNEGGL